ncbi:MAG: transcriptional repressor [Burkholderiales bacterium]|nr:transcriptional repressor [Burkholderiales bacterium]
MTIAPMPRKPLAPADPAAASDHDWADYLRANGLRATRAAIAVLKALDGADLPRSHEELEAQTAPIDRVTLYRVLDRLVATGLVQRIASSDRVGRYVAVQSQASSYFECTTCNRVMPLPEDPELPQLLGHLRRQLEKQGLESALTVFRVQGTCAACKLRAAGRSPHQTE